ncbi:MAG: signal peptidase I [Chloroflexi bacterium]|jgi:signal peptidase|nr:signal peptidase I [Chloroflexota bacterium]
MDLVIMALCAVGLGAGALAFGSRILQYEAYVVRTGSMAPTIPAGSVVIVEPVSPLALKEGDILSYRRPAAPPITVTHRIVFLRLNDDDRNPAPLIRTQGDANGVPDPWQIELYGVAWRAVLWVPWLGYLYDVARQPFAQLLLVGVPGGLMGGWAAVGLARAIAAWRRPSPVRGA